MQTKQDRKRGQDTGPHKHQSSKPLDADTGSGADLIRGTLRYDEQSGNWYLGEINMTPYLARYRDREVMIVIAPLGPAETREEQRLVCDICGCALDNMGDCPRCQLHFVQTARQLRERVQREILFSEIDQIVQERWPD